MVNKTSFTFGLLNPNQASQKQLSAGIYSLSARSNIPFARLIGQGIDKTFTWGETVEVPKGMLCSIYNASYHAGDLFINSGCDLDNKPARITVPVPYTKTIAVGINTYFAPNYPADVRCAKRAYVCFDAISNAVTPSLGFVIGARVDGSHNTTDEIQNAGIPDFKGSGYINSFVFPLSTIIGSVPLGHLAVDTDDTRPQTLLTIATFYIQINVTLNAIPPNAYYTMEY